MNIQVPEELLREMAEALRSYLGPEQADQDVLTVVEQAEELLKDNAWASTPRRDIQEPGSIAGMHTRHGLGSEPEPESARIEREWERHYGKSEMGGESLSRQLLDRLLE